MTIILVQGDSPVEKCWGVLDLPNPQKLLNQRKAMDPLHIDVNKILYIILAC